MSARDLARFALLYLNKGRWQDRQIIPAAWVEESTKAYSHSDLGAGYGYMWWTAPISNGVAPSVSLPDGTFYAAGTGGQYAFVIPTYDLVVVHRAPHPDGGWTSGLSADFFGSFSTPAGFRTLDPTRRLRQHRACALAATCSPGC